ncbi:hypothetical protein MTR_3g116210 [Medicago truncatula]|uniref:RNase H type-1 domain-containing protein n=1 Tax=Medicago truncatula TaxID=3880 RepID=G7J6H6_MEDTR|nr:hypothetical protein MTR_3g116210 [Medicago truncatula]
MVLNIIPLSRNLNISKALIDLTSTDHPIIREDNIFITVTDAGQVIIERAKQLLQNWNFANCKKLISGTAGVAACKWLKPHQGMLKCNVDASFSEVLNFVGFGLCIRDEHRNFIKAKTLWSNPVCSLDVGEALSLHHDIQWVRELQLSNVDFEFDTKKVVDYFNKGNNDISEFGAIMDKCRKNCNDFFSKL